MRSFSGSSRAFRAVMVLALTLAAAIPPVWDVVADDFEGSSLAAWEQTGAVSLAPGAGHNGSTALSVALSADSAYIYQTSVAKAVEGYVTFWFNPNGVAIPEPDPNYWPPGTSLAIAEVIHSGDWWPPLVALYVRKLPGEGYQGFLGWTSDEEGTREFSDDAAFPLVDGWQKITIGYRIDAWVAAWIDGTPVQQVTTGVVHPDPYGDIVLFGKIRTNSSTSPSGSLLLDDYAFQVPRVTDLWVDAASGDDGNDGLTPATAYHTIQKAADRAGPGTTVHVLPGVYREQVWPAMSGSADAPVRYVAQEGPGTVAIRGSEASASLAWTQLTENAIGLPAGVDPTAIYYADLSAWGLEGPPRFVLASGASEPRLPLAREPDWEVATEWKHHEFWWAADGGGAPAACDPATDADPNCDLPSRSMTQLTDRTSDSEPAGVEPGNLTTLGNLTGATLVAIDTFQGHYVYRREITAHDVTAGRVTVDRLCEHDGGSGNPGLGWGSKYYVEGLPALLDSPGEWWYDEATGRLYLWPPAPGDPASQNLEISRRDDGFSLRDRSYVTLDGLTVEMVNHSAVRQHNWDTHRSYGNTLSNVTLRYATYGLYVEQGVSAESPPENVIDGFTLEDSEVAHVDSHGIRLIDWWEDGANPDRFTRSGIRNTTIRNNEFHHMGFRVDGDNAIGLSFMFANELRFEGNHVHHVAHNGVQFSKSVIQSSKSHGFDPGEIRTGEILIRGNLFERACQLTTDCGGLKFWGSPPDTHVFRDVLVTENVFRDTFGWTYVSEKRGRWAGGESSDVRGLGGFGLYTDHVSGIHAYRNVSYNNAYTAYAVYKHWRDGTFVYANNVAANGLYGMTFGGDSDGSSPARILNNALINNEAFGISLGYPEGQTANLTVDHSLYYNNGWRSDEQGGIWHAGAMVIREVGPEGTSWDPYPTLAEVQAGTPWEEHGVAGDPAFADYDPADHDLHDGSWPDFHLTGGSDLAIDAGTEALPASLTALLAHFNVEDERRGTAYDVGRYEAGYELLASPTSRAIEPGGTAHYALSLLPDDLPYAVSLSVAGTDPSLAAALSTNLLAASEVATLTLTHGGTIGTNRYTITVTGSGGGFTDTVQVHLLVGGAQIYLPLILR